MVTILNRPMRYAGTVDYFLRAYTTNYPFIRAGWDWNDCSVYPMEFQGYRSLDVASLGAPVGFAAQLIELKTGYTRLNVGNITTSAANTGSNQFYKGAYNVFNDRLQGFFVGYTGQTTNPTFGDYAMPRNGLTTALPYMNMNALTGLFTQPIGANTGLPWSGNGQNGLTRKGGIYCSYNILNTSYALVYSLTGGQNNRQLFSAFNMQMPTSERYNMNAFIKGSDQNAMLIHHSTGGNLNYNFVLTDWASHCEYYLANAEQPPNTSIDFNAFFLLGGNQERFTGSLYYWMFTDKAIITVEGKTLNGYGLLIASDFSEYKVINFVPVDATAANWRNMSGNPSMKMDAQGVLFMKTAANNLIILSATQGYNRIVPTQIPPVNLPRNPGLYK